MHIEHTNPHYSNMMPNGPLANAYDSNTTALGIDLEDNLVVSGKPSTDMGNVSHVLPALHSVYTLHTKVVNHSKEFTTAAGSPTAQPYTLDQGKVLAMTTIDVFTSPELLAKIKTAFEKRRKELLKMSNGATKPSSTL